MNAIEETNRKGNVLITVDKNEEIYFYLAKVKKVEKVISQGKDIAVLTLNSGREIVSDYPIKETQAFIFKVWFKVQISRPLRFLKRDRDGTIKYCDSLEEGKAKNYKEWRDNKRRER